MAEDFTEDAILDGRLKIRQPAQGYRVNVDTMLLAAAVQPQSGQRLMEAGCGVGAAVLAVACRSPGAKFIGVERDPASAALARANVAANGLQDAVEIVEADVLATRAALGVFDGVFLNPPFDEPGEGRPPAASRAHAHVIDRPLSAWIAALADSLTGGGALTLIHRAAKLAEILAALEGRLGGVEVLPIRPRFADPAKRVLVRARKGSRAPLKLRAGLELHDDSGGKYTPQAEALIRGAAVLDWGD